MRVADSLVSLAKPLLRPLVHRYYRWRDAPDPKTVSYGLEGLDRTLERWLDFDGGVFIEAGANNGVTASNTYYFERHRGWSGLLVEPTPELAIRCVKNRRAPVALGALGAPEQAGTIVPMAYCNMMSVVEGAVGGAEAQEEYLALGRAVQKAEDVEPYTVYAAVVTLSQLIDHFALPQVDLLSLDVEGYERQALAGLDFARHRPRLILVEALFHEAEIRSMLTEHYDFIVEIGNKDLLFRAKNPLVRARDTA